MEVLQRSKPAMEKSNENPEIMSTFSSLPDDCIANIISFTSPKDAGAAAVVSLRFKSATEFDTLWECFLPHDYKEMIARFDSPVVFSTKKELYFLLCDPAGWLLDEAKLSFRLSKPTGNKCCMFCARQIHITWGDTPQYWNWKSLAESRFAEVAELLRVCWLEMEGTFPSEWLSPNTHYAAYLVFKLDAFHYSLDCALKVWVKCVGKSKTEAYENNERTAYIVSPSHGLRMPRNQQTEGIAITISKMRKDGWMEIELGEFFVPEGDWFYVKYRLFGQGPAWKKGLIIEGVEVRPKEAF